MVREDTNQGRVLYISPVNPPTVATIEAIQLLRLSIL